MARRRRASRESGSAPDLDAGSGSRGTPSWLDFRAIRVVKRQQIGLVQFLDQAAQRNAREAAFLDGNVKDVVAGNASRDAFTNLPINHSQIVNSGVE